MFNANSWQKVLSPVAKYLDESVGIRKISSEGCLKGSELEETRKSICLNGSS